MHFVAEKRPEHNRNHHREMMEESSSVSFAAHSAREKRKDDDAGTTFSAPSSSSSSSSSSKSDVLSQIKHTLDGSRMVAAGGGAGIIARTASAPLDRIKLLFQVQAMKSSGIEGTAYTGVG